MLALYGNELEYLLSVLMNTLLFYCFLSSLVHCVWVFNLFYLKFISCVPFFDRLISVKYILFMFECIKYIYVFLNKSMDHQYWYWQL